MIRRPPIRRPVLVRRAVAVVLVVTTGVGVGLRTSASSGPPRRPVVARAFEAVGGPVDVVVAVGHRSSCQAVLRVTGGRQLGRAVSGRGLLHLRATVAAGTSVTLLLHPTGIRPFSWQAVVEGAT